jgi:Protein of unknown function (DUF2946)
MHWFRSRSRLGSWLALFALAFQLAVSFGHVHVDAKGVDAKGLGHAAVLADHASTGADSASPAESDETPALADGYCAVCALIHLAGAVVATQAPDLPVPVLFGATQADPPAQFGLTARSHAQFAARAPPIA